MQEEQKTETPAKANWRPVFIVSDGTAITAETLAHSVLTQFPNLSYDRERIPFIDTVEKAKQTAERINAVQHRTGVRPLVFSTFVDPVISRAFISSNEGFQIELFRSFVGPLEHELCMKSEHTIGATHKIRDEERYNKRIAAIDYTLSHDDGQTNRGLDQAEVILVGVSRSGKNADVTFPCHAIRHQSRQLSAYPGRFRPRLSARHPSAVAPQAIWSFHQTGTIVGNPKRTPPGLSLRQH